MEVMSVVLWRGTGRSQKARAMKQVIEFRWAYMIHNRFTSRNLEDLVSPQCLSSVHFAGAFIVSLGSTSNV